MTDSDPIEPRPGPDGDRLYFRQLLAGRDFAVDDQIAQQMVNFVYLIGDRPTGEAVIVDPAYGVDELLGILRADGMRCVGALATHYHPDHVGGDMMGWGIEGITRLLEVAPVPVHVQADEAPWVARSTGVGLPANWSPTGVGTWSGWARSPSPCPHPRTHPGEPVLPGRRPSDRRRHPVPRRVRPDRPARWGSRGAVRVADHPVGPGARRHGALPRAPLLARSIGHHGIHPSPQLRVPSAHPRAVDDHVRTADGRRAVRRADLRCAR